MTSIDLNFDLWPRQLEALNSPATEILFGGASEGGKSHLVRVLLSNLCIQVPNLQCVLIRKKFDDILNNHVYGPTGFKVLLRPLIERKLVKVTEKGVSFTFNGSNIDFQHCQDERQFDSAQGVEKHVLAVDEATQISEQLIRIFRAWVRIPREMRELLPEKLKDKLPLIIYTANPVGKSVGFFRRHFVKARPPFSVESVHGFLRQYIPSRASDNLSVDLAVHSARMDGLNDEALARALDEGDWDAPIGDFYREYDDEKHTTADFMPPEHWFKYRTFDWGSADPFCVHWWAVSDGEEFIDDSGAKRWFPRGALILYREWYGCNPSKQSEGLGLSNGEIAQGIRDRTREETSGITLTDSLPFNDYGFARDPGAKAKYTIADIFLENGVPLTRANTKRVYGCMQVKSRLKGQDGHAMIYFCESCRFAREYLPAIERDKTNPECCTDEGEASHASDTIRYACAAKPVAQDKPASAEEQREEGKQLTPAKILLRLSRKSGSTQIGRR